MEIQENNKKRKVILFGAGAVMDFGAPSTWELTDLMKNTGFNCIDNKTKITKFICQILKDSSYDEKDINFETIITIIEDFIIHYSYRDNQKKPSLHKVFFKSRFEENLLNYNIGEGSEKHGFTLEIPKNKAYDFVKRSYKGESASQSFFQQLLYRLQTNIDEKISKYTYHTKGFSRIVTDSKKEINENFQNWIKQIGDNSKLRMYTLNYDRLFKVLSERAGIKVFEGFNCGEFVPEEGCSPNIMKILSDFDCNTYYNLHGSVFWEVRTRENRSEIDPEIFLNPSPNLEINNIDMPMIQVEKDKNISFSKIITGYHKTQKSFITPYRQMQSTFDKDCIIADEIYIIGYSFGDEHINTSIKNALLFNDKVTLNFVDPSLLDRVNSENDKILLEKVFIDILKRDTLEMIKSQKKIKENYHEYFEGRLKVNIMKMSDFLYNQCENIDK